MASDGCARNSLGSILLNMFHNVLVYGWYNKKNVGDDLFAAAFKLLFANCNFTFTSSFTKDNIQNTDAVFIGGGSFLNESINISNDLFEILKTKKILYIGVGAETDIHPMHISLMKQAKLIAIRSNHVEKIKAINCNVISIPDLVYCLPVTTSSYKIDKSVLILPNIAVVPRWNDPHWKHVAWDYFKTEFVQFIEDLIADKYTIKFFSMCSNHEIDDTWAAVEIINRMSKRHNDYFINKEIDSQSVPELMSKFNVVITQRYHGIVLSEMVGVPHLTISHHDKLKNTKNPNLSYYGISKQALEEQFNKALNIKTNNSLPIDSNIFSDLKQGVDDALCSS